MADDITDLPGEIWLPIPGYNGIYEVSNHQRVRRIARLAEHGKGTFSRQLAPRMLKTSINNGYLVAYLCPPERMRKARAFYIEAAVAQLFPQGEPELLDVVTGEEWRNIPGFVGYQVSSMGRVRSLDRFVNSHQDNVAPKRWQRGIMMTLGTSTVGYPKVELSTDGEIKTMSVHRLVALAFIPNPDGLPIVHHKDEVKTNNRVENLEWVTSETNVGDWFDRRRITVGVDTIQIIKEGLAAGKTQEEILASLPLRKKGRKRI